MRNSFLLVALLAFSVAVQAQKKSALGFSFNVVDFETPNAIKNTSFSDVLKGKDWYKLNNKDYGFSLYYWRGLTKQLDLSVRYNGLFNSDFTSTNTKEKSDYSNELEASLHAYLLKPSSIVNPFITAGVGVGNYWSGDFKGYAPLGVGLQFNLLDEAYVFLQANYRASFDNDKVPNNLFYSLGVAQSLLTKKEPKVIPPPPAPVVLDTDNDGVVDSLDACPTVAGLASLQGCPDKDGDGIADKDDKCPDVKGLAKYGGCPIPDTDKDGINDEEDACPTVPGIAKYKGCPIPDTDKDGVNDEEDACPTIPGVAANRGCPEIKEEVKKKVDYAATKILFATGSYKLLASSNKGLDEVVKILNETPDLKLNIDGHTDNTGKADKNQILSDNRANAVKEYFIKKGIAESRLTAAGHGQDVPVADNKTAAGRQKNRRVELKLNY